MLDGAVLNDNILTPELLQGKEKAVVEVVLG